MEMSNISEIDKITQISDVIASELDPEQIYLFGSFAKGTQKANSDYDLYVVVSNETAEEMLSDLSAKAYFSLYKHNIKQNRPVDILVNNQRNFENGKNRASLARVILRTGVKLYDKTA